MLPHHFPYVPYKRLPVQGELGICRLLLAAVRICTNEPDGEQRQHYAIL